MVNDGALRWWTCRKCDIAMYIVCEKSTQYGAFFSLMFAWIVMAIRLLPCLFLYRSITRGWTIRVGSVIVYADFHLCFNI